MINNRIENPIHGPPTAYIEIMISQCRSTNSTAHQNPGSLDQIIILRCDSNTRITIIMPSRSSHLDTTLPIYNASKPTPVYLRYYQSAQLFRIVFFRLSAAPTVSCFCRHASSSSSGVSCFFFTICSSKSPQI